MRYLYDDSDIKAAREHAWGAGFHVGAALGFGVALACAAVWALVAGVWS